MVDRRIMAGALAGGLVLATGAVAQVSAIAMDLDACTWVMEQSSPAPLADWSSRNSEYDTYGCGMYSPCVVFSAPGNPDGVLFILWDLPLVDGLFAGGVSCSNTGQGQSALLADQVGVPQDVSSWLARAETAGRLFRFEFPTPRNIIAYGCGANGREYQLQVGGDEFLFVQTPSFAPCGATS